MVSPTHVPITLFHKHFNAAEIRTIMTHSDELSPHVILCSGQSNMARSDSGINWTAPSNLKVWNYDRLFGDESAATNFIDANIHCANYAEFYGASVAINNPELMVYVINLSRGQSSLERWLPNADSLNMLQTIFNNVPAALSKIPNKNSIDELLWWGHESDAAATGGVTVGDFRHAFLSVLDAIDEQPWSNDGQFPIHLHRINRKCHLLADSINFCLAWIALQSPDRITFHDTTCFTYSDGIHLNGDEKKEAASNVYHGHCRMPRIDATRSNNNLLIGSESNSELSVHSKQTIILGQRIYYVVDSARLAGDVVCISAANIERDFCVSLSGQEAILRQGAGKQFTCFHIPRALNETIRLVLIPLHSEPACFSHLKLEKGYGYTPIDDI